MAEEPGREMSEGGLSGRGDKMEATGSGEGEKHKSNEMGLLRSRQEMKFILVPGFPKSPYVLVLCSHQSTYFIPIQTGKNLYHCRIVIVGTQRQF